MTEKRFYTIHKGVYDELKRKELHHGEITSMLNSLHEENEQLKQQLTDCKEKKQQMKEFFMNSEPVIEQKKLQKLIYQTVINLIDEKIKEADEGFEQTYDSWYQGQIDALKELKKELITGESK